MLIISVNPFEKNKHLSNQILLNSPRETFSFNCVGLFPPLCWPWWQFWVMLHDLCQCWRDRKTKPLQIQTGSKRFFRSWDSKNRASIVLGQGWGGCCYCCSWHCGLDSDWFPLIKTSWGTVGSQRQPSCALQVPEQTVWIGEGQNSKERSITLVSYCISG